MSWKWTKTPGGRRGSTSSTIRLTSLFGRTVCVESTNSRSPGSRAASCMSCTFWASAWITVASASAAALADATVIQAEAQKVPLMQLAALEPGDLLFVDSTHTVRPNSEVNLIVLEVLPRLPPGVFVHFHDIYFPYDY